MSAAVTTPLVPPAAFQDSRRAVANPDAVVPPHRTLPLPSLITQRTTACVYGLAALDDRGRLADRYVMRALGWSAGLRLDIGEVAGLLVVRTHPHGAFAVTEQDHLRLPALIRHRCGLDVGDRVLLAADPARRQLIVYPPAMLDSLLTQHHDDLSGGESA